MFSEFYLTGVIFMVFHGIYEGKLARIGSNLYRREDGKYFRLFAKERAKFGFINPFFKELLDIDIATGKDIYGNIEISIKYADELPRYAEFVRVR